MVFEWDLYISYMIDVFIGFYLFDKVFKVKYEKKKTLFLLIVTRAVSSFVMIAVYKNIALQTILTLIEQYILMLIFYKGKPIKKLLYLMYYASVFWISKILWIWIVPVMFLGFELSNLVEFSGLRILMILGVNIVAFLILNSTIKWFNKKTLNDKNFKISLLTLYIFIQYLIVVYITDVLINNEVIIEMIIGIVLIAISVVFFVVFLRYLKNNIKIEVKETQVKNQLETAQKNYKELEENYNNIRRINHDLRNHIQTIMLFEQSASHEEIQKYIDEMKQEVQKWQ